MSESRFRKSLANKMPLSVFVHIESSIGSGVPDTNYTVKANEKGGWLELKYSAKQPKKISLRKGQVVWHRKHNRNGGKSFIALKVGQDKIYIWSGIYSRELFHGIDWHFDIYEDIPCRELDLKKDGWEVFQEILERGEINEIGQRL